MNCTKSCRMFALVLGVFLFPAILFAETIFLKNGQRLDGKIVGQSRTAVTIRVGGATRVVQKADIRRISYDTNNNADELRRQREEAARRRAEEAARKKAEEEAARKAAEDEAARKNAEDEAARKAAEDEAARNAEAEAARKAQEESEAAYRAAGPHRFDAFLRSMVLPGWGQYYQGRTGAAFGLGGAFVAGLGASYYMDQRYNIARSAYEDKADTFFLTSPLVLSALGSSISSPTTLAPLGFVLATDTSNARRTMEDAGRWANNTRTLLVGLYLWNLVDVLVFHPTQEQSVGVTVGPQAVGVRYSMRF